MIPYEDENVKLIGLYERLSMEGLQPSALHRRQIQDWLLKLITSRSRTFALKLSKWVFSTARNAEKISYLVGAELKGELRSHFLLKLC